MRLISFSLTTPQFRDGSKDVTRRRVWTHLQAGDILRAVEKAQGIPKGGHVVRLGTIRIVSVRREPLCEITQNEVRREGFPAWTCADFIDLYIRANGGDEKQLVTRIEFEHVGYCDCPRSLRKGGPSIEPDYKTHTRCPECGQTWTQPNEVK